MYARVYNLWVCVCVCRIYYGWKGLDVCVLCLLCTCACIVDMCVCALNYCGWRGWEIFELYIDIFELYIYPKRALYTRFFRQEPFLQPFFKSSFVGSVWPCNYSKEAYFHPKEAQTHSKELYAHSQEAYIYSKEPKAHSKNAHVHRNESYLHAQMSPV